MSAIFISHSSADKIATAHVSAFLAKQGHRSVFVDFDPERGIPAGREWEKEVYAELRACRACVVLCSERSMRSPWCFAEVTHARALGKAIFPLKVAPCEIHSLLATTQVIDMTAGRFDEGFDRLLRGLRAAGLDPSDIFDWDGTRPPYPGLLALDERDAAVFFGRGKEIRDGLDVLNRQRRFEGAGVVLFLGASGSGKSSLLRAGILPRLRKDPDRWIVVPPFRPLDRPFESLACALAAAFGASGKPRDAKELRARLDDPRSGERLVELARELRLELCRPEGTVLLPVDQLEELFGLSSADDAARFLSTLESATQVLGSRIVVAATLRSDFLGALQTSPSVRGLSMVEILVNPVPASCLGEIVEGPAGVAGLRLEPGLVQAMVQDTQDADALPLLAFALRELWERRGSDGRLTLAAYRDEIGGLAGSVARAAEGLLERVTASDQAELRRAFLSMARIDEEGHFGRRPVASESLPSRIQPLLERFVQARLLVSRGERDCRVLEVAHEALLQTWSRLRAWLEEDRAFLVWRRRLDDALDDWLKANKARERLLTGALLREAEARLKERDGRLTPPEFELVSTSIRVDRRGRRVRKAVGLSLTAALLFSGMYTLEKGTEAQRAAEQARAQTWVSAAANVADSDPLTAFLILRELPRSDEPARTSIVARTIASRPFASAVLVGDHGAVFSPDGTRVLTASADGTVRVWSAAGDGPPVVHRGHDGFVWTAAFSPDGQRVVTASEDRTARLWSPDGRGQPVVLRGHEGPVVSAAFSPDGRRVVTASVDGTARLWSADSQALLVELRGHEEAVVSAAFSADGRRVVTASLDGTARLWSADGSGEPMVLRGHEGPVTSAAFSPDGRRVVTASHDVTARVWDADGQGQPVVLRGHEGPLVGAAFSPDGQRIVTASWDGTARVWTADGQGEPVVLKGHAEPVVSAAFSPDGRRIVTASNDKTARVWSADGRSRPITLLGHERAVSSAAFSPDGAHVVTASWDGTVRVWTGEGEGDPVVLGGHQDHVVSAAFSADGGRVVTASHDKTARVWSVDGERDPIVLTGHAREVKSAAFSPDGRTVVTASDDRTARVWSADGSGRPIVLAGHEEEVKSAAFSPDGKRVVTASRDRTARVWNADGSGNPVVLEGHEAPVMSAAFSPDGARVVTASNDGTARVWRSNGEGEPVVLVGHVKEVKSAAFSPDGKRVVTASNDRTARVWSADGKGEPVVLTGHAQEVRSAAFSPDGNRVLTASNDGTARVWSADGQGDPVVLEGHQDAVVSAAFSADGRHVVTASNDGTARVWSADGQEEPVVLAGHGGAVWRAAFSPDGERVVTASWDGTARLWRVDWKDLLDHLAQRTTACLSIARRVQYLGERSDEAKARHESCEHRLGRASEVP